MLYDLIPNMPDPRLLPLVERFAATLTELPVFAQSARRVLRSYGSKAEEGL